MKKVLLLSVWFILFVITGISFARANTDRTNFPAGVSGIISFDKILSVPVSVPPDHEKKRYRWKFHNPKIGNCLNRKIDQTIFTSNPDSARGKASTDKRSGETPGNICVQIRCAAHASYSRDDAVGKTPGEENNLVRDIIRKEIESAGGHVTGHNSDQTTIQALIPLTAADSLANLPEVDFIHLPSPAIIFTDATTEALDDINADNWHNSGIYGQNTRVGIIDVGFRGYSSLKGTALPATVIAKNFIDGQGDDQLDNPSVSPHGTACAEIIHDIAPAAAIYLAKVWSHIDLLEAVNWMQNNQIDIISTSLGWYNLTPGDGTGELANIVDRAYNAGIFWVTAAGNDRLRHWGGPFSDPDGDGMHNFAAGQNINFFGPGNGTAYLVDPNHTYTIYARWSDWNNHDQDYDIYVYRSDGNGWGTPIASSVNNQDGSPGQTPTEAVEFTTYGEPAAYGFIIYHSFAVTKEVNFEIFAPNAPRFDKVTGNRSLANLADAAHATTVSAVDRDSYKVMPYSAMGPTNGSGGSLTGGLDKPDIAAYTNVSTSTYGPLNFNGTSAATPHVAGTAALILSQYPAFNPAQLKSYLANRAIDIETSGFDFITGWGRLHLNDQNAPPPSCSPPSFISVPGNSSSGSFKVTWGVSSTSSVTYILEEATSSTFNTGRRTAYSGSALSVTISGKNNGIYYYRVKATRSQYNDSPWQTGSNACTVILPQYDNNIWEGYSNLWHSSNNWSSKTIPDHRVAALIPANPDGGHQPLISGSPAAALKLTISGTLIIESSYLTIGK